MIEYESVAIVLSRVTETQTLLVAARKFAALGIPVMPLLPGTKRPLSRHGFHDATTDSARINAWWHQNPEANIGIPTGSASGLVVVDVDVRDTVNGFSTLDRARYVGLVDGWLLLVDSPSGGMHAYYPADPDRVQPCWQIAQAGIDFRGDGGYIVVPPSAVFRAGRWAPYRVRSVNPHLARALDADRLREFLDPRPAPRPRTGAISRPADISRLASWVAARGEGERNRGLFWAACRLAEHNVPVRDALDVLTVAAGSAGLGEREIVTTVRSAYHTAHPAKRAATVLSAPVGWYDRSGPAGGVSSQVPELS